MNAESRLRELVQAHLAANQGFDGVRFIDELLPLAAEIGDIRCTLAQEGWLGIQVSNEPIFEVQLERARPKLRLLCARLSVICNENGQAVSIFGGEGFLRKVESRNEPWASDSRTDTAPAAAGTSPSALLTDCALKTWFVRFMNTSSEHWFVLTAQ